VVKDEVIVLYQIVLVERERAANGQVVPCELGHLVTEQTVELFIAP